MGAMDWSESDVKTWRRADKGGVVYVVVPGTSGYVSSKTKKKADAIEWALNESRGGVRADVTFGVYARDFFIPGICRRVAHMEGAHGKNTLKHWDTLRQLLTAFALPKWGGVMLAAVTSAKVYSWLIDPKLSTVKAFKEGDGTASVRPLSIAQRNKLRVTIKHILDQAAFEGLVPAGIVSLVPVQSSDSEEPDTFSQVEMEKIFPLDLDELDRIWATRRWAAYGLVLADESGPRPSEVLALRWKDWHPSSQAFVCAEKIDSRGLPGPLKSAKKKKGVKKKILLVSTWTMLVLEDLRTRTTPKSTDLLFPASRYARNADQPMRVSAAGSHFLGVLERAGVNRVKDDGGKPRTEYCLRHGANTRARTQHGDAAAQLLLGHAPGSGMTEHYDHPEDAELIARAAKAAGR